MQLPDEAIEAAAQIICDLDYMSYEETATKALEAAAPFLLKNTRRMSLVEIEERDNPERMKAARERVRAEAKAYRSEQIRAAKAEAWDEGLSAGCDRWMDAREFGDKPVNPYTEARNV